MKIKLTESQLRKCMIMEFANGFNDGQSNYNPLADGNSMHNPYSKQIENGIEVMKRFLFSNGRIMVNIDNRKDYIIYEVGQLAQLMGKRFCLCQLYKDGKPFGSVYIKPLLLFKEKTN